MKVTVCRKAHFNAAYQMRNPHWTAEKNLAVFGQENATRPAFHGHNYNLTVKLTGPVNPDTGFVYDMKQLGQLIKSHVENKFDHRNLYLDMDDFKDTVPTPENLAIRIWHILREHIDAQYVLTVELHESNKNFVEYSGA